MIAHRKRLSFFSEPYLAAGLLPLVSMTILLGCRQEVVIPKKMPRPVSALVLEKTDPTRRLRLAGAVKAWKEEDVGFEVSGRVGWTIDEGAEVQGRTRDENGELLTEGTILARLDSDRYKARVSSAEAQVKAIEAEGAAVKIDIEQVLPEQLKSAQAQLTRATKEHDRAKRLLERGAGTQAELDSAEAELKSARAAADQAQAMIVAKGADLASLEARAQEAAEAAKEAKLDLRDCELVSPFDGRVSKVHVIPGAFVDPGRPVVTVVVMDPIKVEVAVSPATDRKVAVGDVVEVYPPGREKPQDGWVYTKETAADPRTRTFNLSIMVRNWQVPMGVAEAAAPGALPTIKDLTRCHRLTADEDAPLYVDTQAVHRDAQGDYVWKAEGIQYGQAERRSGPVFAVKRVRIGLGERRYALLGMILREVVDTGGLSVKDMLVLGPPEVLKDGDRVAYIRTRWLFRPGDVASVSVDVPKPGAGFYVPMDAIKPVDDQTGQVFVVKEGKVQKVTVTLLGHVDDQFRIEAADPSAASFITEGAQIINKDIHFLVPGEPVRVVKTERAKS